MRLKDFLLDMVMDDGRRVSSSRVMLVLTFVVASVIVLWLTWNSTLNVEYFLAYLGLGSGTFSWAKYVEARAQPQDQATKR